MSVLVTDKGFNGDDWRGGYVPLAALSDQVGGCGLDLDTPQLTRRDWARLCRLLPQLGLIRVRLRDFGDLAALDLARALRAEGYRGRLRAHGAVLAVFLTMLRRSGFDEVELDCEQARLQPAEHWRVEEGWTPAPPRAPRRPV